MPARRLLLAVLLAAAGCGAIRGVRAVEDLDASLVRVTGVEVGGVRVDLSAGGELPVAGLMVLGAGALAGRVPVACEAIVRLANPVTSRATAELLRSRWTLRLGDRDLAAGVIQARHSIPPGRSVDVPVRIALDLADVLGRDPDALVAFVAALAGDRRTRLDVRLRLVPILDTPLGGVPLPPLTIPLA